MHGNWQGQWDDEGTTAAFARGLAARLRGGDCLALVGDLAAGKTTFTRCLAEALGIDVRQQFSSPTYTYANEYAGASMPMVHIDLYRLEDEAAARALGLEDALARRDALVVVEWADRLVDLLPAHALWLRLQVDWSRAGARAWAARGPLEVGERLLGPAAKST